MDREDLAAGANSTAMEGVGSKWVAFIQQQIQSVF